MTSDDSLVAGRYRLESVIGSGGLGTVWRAEDLTLGRPVAVKELRFTAYATPAERAALERQAVAEARAAADLDHPHIVDILDVVQHDGRPWIVMRLIDGRSLATVVREDGPLPEAEVRRIALALLDALEAAHAAGVVHRDVKPANVLLGTDGAVALGDFSVNATTATATSTGVLLGSPSYLAPEQLQGGAAGPAADLYGLGATLYFATEGRGPFDGRGPQASLTEPPAPPAAAGSLTPAIVGLLAREPETRLSGTALRALLTGVGAPPASALPTVATPVVTPAPPALSDADTQSIPQIVPSAPPSPPPAAAPTVALSTVNAPTVITAQVPAPEPPAPNQPPDASLVPPPVPELDRPIWDAATGETAAIDSEAGSRRGAVLVVVGILVLAVLVGVGLVLRGTEDPVATVDQTPSPSGDSQEPVPLPAPSTEAAPPTSAAPTSSAPTTTRATPTTPPAGRVTGSTISASTTQAAFPCKVSTSASVTVSGPTTVKYRVVNDQGSSTTYSLAVTKAGTRTLTAPQGQSHRAGPGWVELRITSPTAVTKRANFALPAHCTAIDTAVSMPKTTHNGDCRVAPSWNIDITLTPRFAPANFTYTLFRSGQKVFSETIPAAQPNQPIVRHWTWRTRDPGEYYVTVDAPYSGASNRITTTVTCT